MSTQEFEYVRDLVFKRSAIVLDVGKEYLVESRLMPLARSEGLRSIDELIVKLRADPSGGLQTKVVEAMTTNETSFFRDEHPFEGLRTHVFPAIRNARAATRTLRIWSAACSTGQEPYSVAMVLREHFPELASWNVSILCTDLSSAMVARTKAGLYGSIEVGRGLPPRLLAKYFDAEGGQHRANAMLGSLLQCRTMNLVDTWPALPTFDVVLLRNVLIYFDVPTKRRILQNIRRVLASDGYLLLGGAETTLNIDESFRRVQVGKTAYYCHATPERAP